MKLIIQCGFIAFIAIISGCKKKSNNPPAVGDVGITTKQAQNITNTGALLGGNITSKGSCLILSKGVVVSKLHGPTTNDLTFPNTTAADTGEFTVNAAGLLPATTYYAKAFAVNCNGISYGNEITFTTTIGGGGSDTSYFHLTIDGVTYPANDLMGPNASKVFPEGDTRFAFLTIDTATGEFTVTTQSSFVFDVGRSFGFNFSILYKSVTGLGTYTFTDASVDNTKAVSMQFRKGTGTLDPSTANADFYQNQVNKSRHRDASNNCISSNLACALNMLHITRWENAGGFVEGTLSGTVYEFTKADMNCVNSTAHPYSVDFKLKRLQ